MANPIKNKNSGNGDAFPSTLEHRELGLKYADGKLFYKNTSNTIVEFSSAGSSESSLPSGGLEGQMLVKATDTDYDTEWIDNYTGDLRIIAKNDSGVTISKGQAVMAVGAVGDRIRVEKAVSDGSVSSKYMLGVASQDITNGTEGYVQMLGEVRNINTIAYSIGTILYIDPNTSGNLTSTLPVAPNLSQAIAIVTRSHETTGILFVRMWSQGGTISELHDVSIVDKTSGDFLKYNGTLWVNDQINLGTDTVGNYMSNVTAGNLITVTHTPGEGSSAAIAVTSGTSGQIIVANATGVPTFTTISGDITVSNTGVVTIQANSVALGTDTTGDYVSSLVAGSGITLSNNSGEGATPTVALTSNSLTVNGTSIALGGSGTITANASTLTGTSLNSSVTGSNLTSVGTLTSLSVSGNVSVTGAVVDHVVTNQQTASYTLALTDDGDLVEMNVGTANNLTVPADNGVNFPIGTSIDILQVGAGQTTLVAASGVTINRSTGLKLRTQWSAATLIKRAANTWVAIGDLSA